MRMRTSESKVMLGLLGYFSEIVSIHFDRFAHFE
jgi:hypothetical protein